MREQKPLSGDYQIVPLDDERSLFLVGPASQKISEPDRDGSPMSLRLRPGFSFRLYNLGAAEAVFSPASSQAQAQQKVAAGASATFELEPSGIWSRS